MKYRIFQHVLEIWENSHKKLLEGAFKSEYDTIYIYILQELLSALHTSNIIFIAILSQFQHKPMISVYLFFKNRKKSFIYFHAFLRLKKIYDMKKIIL